MRRIYGTVVAVLLLLLVAGSYWLFMTPAGLQWAYARAQNLLPGSLRIDSLSGRLAGPLTARGIRYESKGVDAQIHQATFDWSPFALLTVRLHIDKLTVDGARIALQPAPATEDATGAFDLPVRLSIERFAGKDVRIERSGKEPFIVSTARFAGQLDSERLVIRELELRTSLIDAEATGDLGIAGGEGESQIQWRLHTATPLAGTAKLSGSFAALSAAIRTTEPVVSELDGQIEDVFSLAAWRAEFRLPNTALAKIDRRLKGAAALDIRANGDRRTFRSTGTWRASYPDIPAVQGDFRLNGSMDGELILEALQAQATGTESRITAKARWNITQRNGTANIEWRNLAWPLAGDAVATSARGALDVAGGPTSYQLTLRAEVQGKQVPPTTINATGKGDTSQLALDRIELRSLDGTLSGAGGMKWSPTLDWNIQARGKNFNPGAFWRDWHGDLAIDVQASGNESKTQVALNNAQGSLRGRSFRARGNLLRRGSQYPAITLHVRSGDAVLNANGSLHREWSIAWQLNAPDLADLLPDASGTLSADGYITGDPAKPRIAARADGRRVAYGDVRARTLTINLKADLSDRERSMASINTADVLYGDRLIDHAEVAAEGLLTEHTLRVAARAGENAIQMQLAGGYEGAWRGQITKSTWTVADEQWTLAQPADWMLGAEHIAIANTCWTAGNARLCARFARDPGQNGEFALTAARVPLALFAPLLAQPVTMRGYLNGDATVLLRAGVLHRANANFETANGSVRIATDTGPTLAYERIALALAVDDAGLRSRTELRLPGNDGGVIDIALPRFATAPRKAAEQPLQGQIQLTIRDLSPLGAMLPDIEELRGELRANIRVRGTLAEPEVDGDARLTDASAHVPMLGLLLREMRIIATPDTRGMQINGFARSGEGQIGISGRVAFGDDPAWRVELRLAGADFLIADIPEARIVVAPDLKLTAKPGAVNVQGDVRIPRARIAPKPQTTSIAPSPDVVIAGAPEDGQSSPAGWSVTASINVALGDAVSFDGFGLTGNVTGNLTLIDSPDQVTTARGELRVLNGRYEAYGQKLEVQRGRLLFASGPVDDPGIDARAIRRVENITAGIEVRGTLRSPQLTLFSDPAMGQSDTLSYLLFGRPMERADASQGASLAAAARALQLSGGEFLAKRIGTRFGIEEVDIQSTATSDASLVLGKRLSPRLYINYSIGLFEPINVFRIRYELTTHWVLQAESGRNRGADLLYTIER